MVGNAYVRHRLITLAKENRLPHALLLSGPEGTSKYRFLEDLTTELLGTANALPPLLVKVNHLYLEGQTKEDDLKSSTFDQSHRKKEKKKTDTIGVDDVESFTHHLFETVEGRYKIVLIRNIERFTREASNKLLKILEEPPAKTIFLMTTSQEYSILPTIFSRVQKETFSLVSDEELRTGFTFPTTPTETDQIIKMAAGRPEECRKLKEDREYFLAQKEEWEALERLDQLPWSDVFTKSEALAKDSWEQIIGFLERYLVVLRTQLVATLAQNDGRKSVLLQKRMEKTISTRNDLKANGNKRLVLENFFMHIREGSS